MTNEQLEGLTYVIIAIILIVTVATLLWVT